MSVIEKVAQYLGFTWFGYQLDTFDGWQRQPTTRACLYYKTGAGKTYTSLMMMKLRGVLDVLVVTPPSTYGSWEMAARKLGISVECISHAKFRQKGYKLSKDRAVIVDEFHMLGGHGGQGFKKLDTLAKHIRAPLIICSATPNYNDAERVYCVAHVLNPIAHKGGYLAFLYRHCQTEADPFSTTPKVVGFHNHPDAAAFLASLPGVYYLPDDLVYQIEEVDLPQPLPSEFEDYGYNRRKHRMVASAMERRHAGTDLRLVDEQGRITAPVRNEVHRLIDGAPGPVLLFANHATVAVAMAKSLAVPYALVTGGMTTKNKAQEINRFKRKDIPVLIGTASLATGTDGLDKMCDTLIILDDTDDDSLRRQLIGRIMPRGADTDTSRKQVFRINVDDS